MLAYAAFRLKHVTARPLRVDLSVGGDKVGSASLASGYLWRESVAGSGDRSSYVPRARAPVRGEGLSEFGYVSVVGRQAAVCTPTFFAHHAGRYWFFARRKTMKVASLRESPAASLLFHSRGSDWILVAGHIRVLDVLQPSLRDAFVYGASTPVAISRLLIRNGRSLADLWRQDPGLFFSVATAMKVLLCLHPEKHQVVQAPRNDGVDAVFASRAGRYPLSVPARWENSDHITVAASTSTVFPDGLPVVSSITKAVERNGTIEPRGSVTLGHASWVNPTRMAFERTATTLWDGTQRIVADASHRSSG